MYSVLYSGSVDRQDEGFSDWRDWFGRHGPTASGEREE